MKATAALRPTARLGRAAIAASRVLRGGSWFFIPKDLRSAHRGAHTADNPDHDIGFRIARTLTP